MADRSARRNLAGGSRYSIMRFMKALAALWLLIGAVAYAATGTIVVDSSKPGPKIASSLYGIFFEEISHAGEGGLYAELIQNRGFEDANLPPACKLEGRNVVPPR